MHKQALEYVKWQTSYLRRPWPLAVEFGARDVNGTPRSVVEADEYIGIDIADGPGVDIVVDAADWDSPYAADLVLCCETLEHTPRAWEIVHNAGRTLRAGGTFVMTCATDPRAPHSAHDGGPLRLGEHYKNVTLDEMREWCDSGNLDVVHAAVQNWPNHGGDLYVTAIRRR